MMKPGNFLGRSCAGVLVALAGLVVSSFVYAQITASEGLVEVFHTVKLERGTNLNIVVSKRENKTPTVAALLFAGYPGVLKIREEAGVIAYDLAGNFLLRARRHLNSDDVFTVMVDCPTDRWNSCDDDYRSSAQHTADIGAVVDMI